jgi:hypothetical protein
VEREFEFKVRPLFLELMWSKKAAVRTIRESCFGLDIIGVEHLLFVSLIVWPDGVGLNILQFDHFKYIIDRQGDVRLK